MPDSKYYARYKNWVPFSKLCPLWHEKLKEDGIEMIFEPKQHQNIELDMEDVRFCIVGEAWKYTNNYLHTAKCDSCIVYGNLFAEHTGKVKRLVKDPHSKYYYHTMQEYKKELTALKKDFAMHFNRIHIGLKTRRKNINKKRLAALNLHTLEVKHN